MISPLLHLLQRGDRAARSHAVTHLAALPPGPSYAAPPVPRGMLFLSGGDTGDMALARIVQRYPRLSTLHTTSNVPDGQAGHPRLLVIGAGVADAGPAILEATATGMLVVSPDDGAGAKLIQDGITGFHYRTRNPDSLALALLTLEKLPADFLQIVIVRARATFHARHPGQPAVTSPHPHGEPA